MQFKVMAFKLIEVAQNRWIRLAKSEIHMAEIIKGIPFRNGIAQKESVDYNATDKDVGCAA